jgi:Vacuolar sorting-associated protein 13, N-terminal
MFVCEQVSVQRVHIRFEDDVTCPEYAIACGIMLQEASLETTDEQWRPDWIGCNVPVVYKVNNAAIHFCGHCIAKRDISSVQTPTCWSVDDSIAMMS